MQHRHNRAQQKVSHFYSPKGAITLKRSFEDDPEEEPITFEKIKPGARELARSHAHAQPKPTRKTSYESSADVQRDVERVCQYFAPYDVQCNAHELAREIWSGHMGPIPELI
jgi:hypothetical protein